MISKIKWPGSELPLNSKNKFLGTVGIYALKECKAAHVHFTDYNEEVIERNLMDSVFINEIDTIEKISASSGDWSKLELKDEKE